MSDRLDRTLYYCPKCQAQRKNRQKLCEHCGETCRKGGFCPICDVPLLQPVGAFCPKHEVELLDPDAEELDQTPEIRQTTLSMIRSFNDAAEADAARLRLEAEGIPTFLDAERMGSQSFYLVATGGVKLLVPKDLEADARVILNQVWSLPKTEEEEVDDEWDQLGPDPGVWRRTVMKGAIIVMLGGPLLVISVTAFADFFTWLRARF